jgi:hypothetical protein
VDENQMSVTEFELGRLTVANPSVDRLYELQQSVNPSYLDWLKFWGIEGEVACVDLVTTIMRIVRVWTWLGHDRDNGGPVNWYAFGPEPVTLENIQATLFQYEIDVPKVIVRKAFRVLLQVGLFQADTTGRFVCTRPSVKQ